MDIEKIAGEIISRVQALSNPTTPELRAVRREFSKRIAKEEPGQVVELALLLLNESGNEYRYMAYEFVNQHKAALQSLDADTLERLGQGMDSWVAVDTFGSSLSGPAWREHQVADDVIHGWARSDDRWWRRAALVSTVPLNIKARGGTGDTPRTLAVCKMLVSDRDDMVVKAMSWALRELAKRDSESVEGFLEENEDVLAARVKREVRNKLTSGLKNPRI